MKKQKRILKGRKFFIHTFGCQMNENDSEHIAGILRSLGASPAESPEESHIIIVNTCAVRKKSAEKLYSLLGRIRKFKEKHLSLLGVTGCVAQLEQTGIIQRFPCVDFVMGPDNYKNLPDLFTGSVPSPVFCGRDRDWHEIDYTDRTDSVSGYVTIMEGCSNFCAYCVVPYTRGPEKYRPCKNIMDEVKAMIKNGYREVQLLGQNVNSYRDPVSGKGFPYLLHRISRVKGLDWLRFVTSHPKDFDRSAALVMQNSPSVCRQLHLPVQSGSNRILEAMNRRYSREKYLDTISMLKDLMPDISLSTDIIVGFPGESETDFEQTLDILRKIRYTNIFSFRYSPRPKTKAGRWKDDVAFEVKRKRLIHLQNLQKNIQLEDNRKSIGKTMKVLVTGRSKKNPEVYAGRNEAYQVVNFTSQHNVLHQFAMVEITGAGPYSLRGRMLDNSKITD